MNNFLSPKETAEAFDGVAVTKASHTTANLWILGIFAGIYIAFGGFAAATISHTITSAGVAKFASGAVFPVGLMLVVITGTELFTGNNLMVIGYMDKKITLQQLLRNWVWVYLANFVGSIIFAFLVSQTGLFGSTGGALGATVINTALAKVSIPFGQALVRGILCNILVVLAVWMATAAKDVISKIFACWFPVMLFVMSGFEHSIANMYFIPAGIFAKANAACVEAGNFTAEALAKLNFGGLISNLVPVTIGNIIGGAIVIGLSYWYVYRFTPQQAQLKKSESKTA
jgi:formate/nitrite transporter